MTIERLNKINRWLTIVTVAVALLYGGYFFYHELTTKSQCCDGPCWNPDQDVSIDQ